jgi:hypothetical protein
MIHLTLHDLNTLLLLTMDMVVLGVQKVIIPPVVLTTVHNQRIATG